jgi:hypothetical protein
VTKPPICRYPAPELRDLPDDIRERIQGLQEKSGVVPTGSPVAGSRRVSTKV